MRAKQTEVCLGQPMCAKQTEVCSASADARGAKQRSVRLSRCARSKTEVCLASAKMFGPNQALDWLSENVWSKSSARSASAKMFGANQALDRLQRKCLNQIKRSIGFSENVWPQTEVCSAQPMCAHARGSHSRTKTMGEQRQDAPRSLPAEETDRPLMTDLGLSNPRLLLPLVKIIRQ